MNKKIIAIILFSLVLSTITAESAQTTGSVIVTVKGLFGQRLGDVALFMHTFGADAMVGTTDSNGQALIKNLKPGKQQIGAQGRYFFRIKWATVNVVAGKTTPLTITYI